MGFLQSEVRQRSKALVLRLEIGHAKTGNVKIIGMSREKRKMRLV